MKKYSEYRLGSICSRLSSGKGITSESIFPEGEYPVYGGNGLRGYTTTKNFTGACAIIGRQGAYCGNVKFFEGEAYMTEHAVVVVAKPEHNTRYLSLVLDGLKLGRLSGQAAQPGLSVKQLAKIKVFMPEKCYQDKIANLLAEYDLAIENNNKRISILEQMAENLYKEWFVRFRFPGHENVGDKKSRIGKIPRNFDVLKMKDVFESYIGGGWGNDDKDTEFTQGAYVIRGADFPYVTRGDLSTCPYRYHKKSNYASRKLEDGDIIIEVSGGTAEQPVGRTVLVNKEMLDRFDGTVICASFCKLVRLKKKLIQPEYFYYWMKFLYETRIIDRFQLQSTGIINFKFEFFTNKGDLLMPPVEIMNMFSNYVKVLNDEKSNIARQNENLIKQRDLLLPRLMSGKLQVK